MGDILFTGCEACTALAGGAQRVTKQHVDECRRRMDELMQRDEDALVQQRLHADSLRMGLTVAVAGTPAPATQMVGSDPPTGRGEETAPQVAEMTESTKTTQGDDHMGMDGSRIRGLKRPAETELDDGTRTRANTDSAEHLDGDVPVTAPTVQQAKQAAAAADAHMSVGTMEMMSRAAAKVTTSEQDCDSVEQPSSVQDPGVRTQPKQEHTPHHRCHGGQSKVCQLGLPIFPRPHQLLWYPTRAASHPCTLLA